MKGLYCWEQLLLDIFDVVVQLPSCIWLSSTPHFAAHQSSLSLIISWSLPEFMSIESVMPFNHLIVCCLLLPSIFPSIRIFSSEMILCIRSPNYWSFSISPSNEYSALIFFKTEWFDLLAVQGNFKSLCTVVQKQQFFGTLPSLMVYLSYLCMTTRKTIALSIWTFVGKVIVLAF